MIRKEIKERERRKAENINKLSFYDKHNWQIHCYNNIEKKDTNK